MCYKQALHLLFVSPLLLTSLVLRGIEAYFFAMRDIQSLPLTACTAASAVIKWVSLCTYFFTAQRRLERSTCRTLINIAYLRLTATERLFDWESGILSALRPVLQQHRLELPDQDLLELYSELDSRAEQGEYHTYRNVLRLVMKGMAKALGFDPRPSEIECLERSLEHWLPFPDTVDALNALSKRYRLAIISNIDNDLFSLSAAHLQVPFDWVITAEQVRSYKPSLKNFEYAPETIGIPSDEVLHVAQSIYHDIAPAKKLGLATMWVNRRHGRAGAGATPPAVAQPDLEVPDLLTLLREAGLGG